MPAALPRRGSRRRPATAYNYGVGATDERIDGTVVAWDDEAGVGRIEGDDGHPYFALFSYIHVDGYRTLEVGERVRVRWKGRYQDDLRAPESIRRVVDLS